MRQDIRILRLQDLHAPARLSLHFVKTFQEGDALRLDEILTALRNGRLLCRMDLIKFLLPYFFYVGQPGEKFRRPLHSLESLFHLLESMFLFLVQRHLFLIFFRRTVANRGNEFRRQCRPYPLDGRIFLCRTPSGKRRKIFPRGSFQLAPRPLVYGSKRCPATSGIVQHGQVKFRSDKKSRLDAVRRQGVPHQTDIILIQELRGRAEQEYEIAFHEEFLRFLAARYDGIAQSRRIDDL